MLGCKLMEMHSPKRLKNTKMTVRSQYWKLITELMKNTEIQQEEWPEKWRNVAQDGKLWKKLAGTEIKKVAGSAETSTWTEKHAEGSELLAPPTHKRAAESDIPRFVRCEKCGENVHPNGYRVHLRARQGTEKIRDEPGGRLCSVKDAMGGSDVFCGMRRTVRVQEHEAVEDRTEEKCRIKE